MESRTPRRCQGTRGRPGAVHPVRDSTGLQPGPRAAPRASRVPPGLAASVALAVWRPRQRLADAGLAAPTAASGLGPLPTASQRPLNLVVITLDTTRADHLGAYGVEGRRDPCPRPPRPRRRALRAGDDDGAADAAGAREHLHRPVPARARRARQRRLLPGPGADDARRDAAGPQGFKTGGFVAAYVLDGKWGIGQGFETYFDDFDSEQVAGQVARRDPAAGQRGRRQSAAVD